jgi:hypothetical protein
MILGWSGSISDPFLITFISLRYPLMLDLNYPNSRKSLGVYTTLITSLKSSPPPSKKSVAIPV